MKHKATPSVAPVQIFIAVILSLMVSAFVLVGCAQSETEDSESGAANSANIASDEESEGASDESADTDSDDGNTEADDDVEEGINADADEETYDIVLNANAADEVDDSYEGQLEDVEDAGEEPERGEGL